MGRMGIVNYTTNGLKIKSYQKKIVEFKTDKLQEIHISWQTIYKSYYATITMNILLSVCKRI